MTTISTSSVILHGSDADFQAWVDEFHGLLVGCGLVQTADTGQLASPCVAARPGSSTYAGYEIWRFNDSLQGTAPIFMKWEYGTSSSTAIPSWRLTIGTGSDGAGTITGVVLNNVIPCPASTTTAAGAWTHYACHTEGVFFICFGALSAQGRSRSFAAISRTCDTAGNWTAEGAVTIVHGGGSSLTTIAGSRAWKFSPLTTFNFRGQSSAESNNFFWLPGSETTTDVGGDTQTFPCVIALPNFVMAPGFGVVMNTELTIGSTAPITYIGSTPKTYIQMEKQPNQIGCRNSQTDDAEIGLVIVWE